MRRSTEWTFIHRSVRRAARMKSRSASAGALSNRHHGVAKRATMPPRTYSTSILARTRFAPGVAGGRRPRPRFCVPGDRLLRRLIATLVVSLLGLASPPPAQSRTTTADMVGYVSDQSKAMLPGATVTATNLDTNFTRTAVTEASRPLHRPGAADRHLHRARRTGRLRPPRRTSTSILYLGTTRATSISRSTVAAQGGRSDGRARSRRSSTSRRPPSPAW